MIAFVPSTLHSALEHVRTCRELMLIAQYQPSAYRDAFAELQRAETKLLNVLTLIARQTEEEDRAASRDLDRLGTP